MSIETAVETVEIENVRARLRELGTDLDTVTQLEDGRWFVGTAGRHRIEVLDADEQTAIRRAGEIVEGAYGPKQTAWLPANPDAQEEKQMTAQAHDIKACGHPSHQACCTRCGSWRVDEREGVCRASREPQEEISDYERAGYTKAEARDNLEAER